MAHDLRLPPVTTRELFNKGTHKQTPARLRRSQSALVIPFISSQMAVPEQWTAQFDAEEEERRRIAECPRDITEVYVKINYNEWITSLRVCADLDEADDKHDEELKKRNKLEQTVLHALNNNNEAQKVHSTLKRIRDYRVKEEKSLPSAIEKVFFHSFLW